MTADCASSTGADTRKGITMMTTIDPSNVQRERFAMNRRATLMLLIGGAAGVVAPSVRAADDARKVTLYKDPECGCCEGYADYLGGNGFAVAIVPTHDLPLLDEKYGIPADLQPCHISLTGGYVVGGHVPIEIVNRLLAEKPRIAGITLPGMPLGSPGMGGEKTAPFKIYEIAKGSRRVYATV
jgi:hypothetical protein